MPKRSPLENLRMPKDIKCYIRSTPQEAPRTEPFVAGTLTLLRTVFKLCTVTQATFSKRSPLGNVRTPKDIIFSNRNNTTSIDSNRALCRPSQNNRGIWARSDVMVSCTALRPRAERFSCPPPHPDAGPHAGTEIRMVERRRASEVWAMKDVACSM